jgi:hypothetical protein
MPTQLAVSIEFLPTREGGRLTPPEADGRYCPHLRVRPNGTYLGVRFVGGSELALGTICSAIVELMYEGVDYSVLSPGVAFAVCEGPSVVGTGVVKGRVADSAA